MSDPGSRPHAPHLTFETAAQHATARVPIVEPGQTVGAVLERLVGGHFESASHLVVCSAGTFLGIATLEDVLSAPADATIDTVMDHAPPIVAPGVDQEVAAWRAVRHGESALAVVTGDGHRSVGLGIGSELPRPEFIAIRVIFPQKRIGTSATSLPR
jgi:magnesium transporter